MKTLVRAIIVLGSFVIFTVPALAADKAAGKTKYDAMCASCHGATGKGDGAAAAALNPKPRDFSDAAWQAKVTDDHLKKTIKDGGAAVGLSAMMPPWGSALSDADIANIVAYIRSLAPAKK